MASPQPDKYTKISNELAEAFARHRLSGNEWRVLWVILRNTYGWNRKKHAMSYSFIAKATGILEHNVVRIIGGLLDKKIVGVIKNDSTHPNIYYLNKDYEEWQGVIKTDRGVIKTDTARVIKTDNQQRNILKKEYIYPQPTSLKGNPKQYPDEFEKFWKEYPRKVSKYNAYKKFHKINPNPDTLKEIIEGAKRYAQEKRDVKQEYIKYAEGWLNGRRWEDQLETDNKSNFFKT